MVAAVNEQIRIILSGREVGSLRVVIVAGEGRGDWVEARQAATDGADPDEALAVAGQAENAVAAEGGRIGWVMAIIFDAETIFIEDIDPGAIGSNVEEAGVAFVKAADFGMGEAGRVERIGQEAHEIWR